MDIIESDRYTIGECLNAVAFGPFLPDWEFDTLMGASRQDLAALASRWPEVDLCALFVRRAVQNTLANLVGYPIDAEEKWADYISVPRSTLHQIHMRFDALAAGNE